MLPFVRVALVVVSLHSDRAVTKTQGERKGGRGKGRQEVMGAEPCWAAHIGYWGLCNLLWTRFLSVLTLPNSEFFLASLQDLPPPSRAQDEETEALRKELIAEGHPAGA